MIGRRKKSRGIKTRMRKPKKNFLLVTRAPLRLFQGSSGEKGSRPYVAYVPPPRRTRYRSRDHLYGSSELVSLLFLLPRVEVHEEAGRSKKGERGNKNTTQIVHKTTFDPNSRPACLFIASSWKEIGALTMAAHLDPGQFLKCLASFSPGLSKLWYWFSLVYTSA